MQSRDVIIVGAGAAGLMCARELLRAGNSVSIIEARERIGGRIYTLSDEAFPENVELGAEFIHGDLPLTKKLLQEAGITFYEIQGEILRFEKGAFVEQDELIEDAEEVVTRLKKLTSDVTVADFLSQHFGDQKWSGLRQTLTSYVEGYDAADVKSASSFALLSELMGSEEKQYRIEGGYAALIDFLALECKKGICDIYLEKNVTNISWAKEGVQVTDQHGTVYSGAKAVVTVPLGVLQTPPGTVGSISFSPAIPSIVNAIQRLGSGNVIKIIVAFKEELWRIAGNLSDKKHRSNPGFIFSDAVIPTWWTQYPKENGTLTGWIGGPKAERLANETNENILQLALESLSVIFKLPRKMIEDRLSGWQLHNWVTDNFAKGGYSYEAVYSKNAKSIISEGVENTLFFAGEAYWAGPESGTVEAALISGEEIAKKIVTALQEKAIENNQPN